MIETAQIPILLLEDQAMVRHGLVALINTLERYRVGAAAASVAEALALLRGAALSGSSPFALILSDYHLGDDTALGLFRDSQAMSLPPVILLTSIVNAVGLKQAIQQGVRGLLYKECDAGELSRAFDAIVAGGVYFTPGLGLSMGTMTAESSNPASAHQDKPQLTPSEREILQWLATGMSNKEIARLLGKSAETVKIQVSQLMRKLGCKTRTEVVVNASRRGLI